VISVTIDNRLRVRKHDLPPGHEAQIKQRLTVVNGERAAARKRQQWGWQDLPESFALYEDQGPVLVMPRGFAAELRAGLQMAGHEVRWDDHTAAASLRLNDLVLEGPTLRPDQEVACSALLLHRQGVLQAPTSAGKTVLILEAWRRTGLRGLVLVEKAGLAKQWRERAREHLGVETGMIGEGEWEERNLTVAMLQTLHRREIGDEWFRRWGFTALDEAHHARAGTYQAVLRRVVSRYVVGVTATPLEGMWEQPLLTSTIGPIFHITSPGDLRRQGKLVTPTVHRVHTGWRWVPQNAREKALVDPKTIYRYVVKALEQDERRVNTIALNVIAQPSDCAQLVVSKRLAYLDRIRTALEDGGYEGEVYDYRGSVSGDERTQVAQAASGGHCVILATVADEGVDIPRLDRLHLTWPQRQELGLVQQLGRVLRTHPDKREVVVYDYVDDEGVLVSQATARVRVYRKSGYPVEEVRLQGSFIE
jgi:superfamily II DNA or RNA helicase